MSAKTLKKSIAKKLTKFRFFSDWKWIWGKMRTAMEALLQGPNGIKP
jgi:hypothetical protein